MLFWQAIVLAVLQGVSELFPVSSLGQTILIPDLLHWDFHQNQRQFLAFLVALHLATAVALGIYFWKDWREVLMAFAGSVRRRKLVYDKASKFAWLLVAGTVVVGAAGLALEHKIRTLFEKREYAWVVASILIVNGFIMMLGDAMKRRVEREEAARGDSSEEPVAASGGAATAVLVRQRKEAEQLTFVEAGVIGASQTLALLPGISRSGVTIVCGLLAGLSYEQASRFSFMLATPVIGLAALLKVPELFKPEARGMLKITVPAALVAGITAYLSVKFLMRYFKHHRLSPFGIYCIGFGILCLVLLKMNP